MATDLHPIVLVTVVVKQDKNKALNLILSGCSKHRPIRVTAWLNLLIKSMCFPAVFTALRHFLLLLLLELRPRANMHHAV